MRILIILVLALQACKHSSQDNDQLSKLKHNFSELSRDNSQMEIKSCRDQPSKTATKHNDPRQTEIESKLSLFLQDMATEIMDRTNDSLVSEGFRPVFSGQLAANRFCYQTKDQDSINGSMSQDLQVTIPLANFRYLQAPAFASVMCHELAHATMLHRGAEGIRQDIFQELSSDKNFQDHFQKAVDEVDALKGFTIKPELVEEVFGADSRLYQRYHSLFQNIELYSAEGFAAIFMIIFNPIQKDVRHILFGSTYHSFYQILASELEDNLGSLETPEDWSEKDLKRWTDFVAAYERLKQADGKSQAHMKYLHDLSHRLDQTYGGGRFSFVNWYEAEADEVGYEICLRSAVDSKGFQDLFAAMLEETAKKAGEATLNDCKQLLENGEIPERGTAIHPELCFRYYNLNTRESLIHQEEYEDLKRRHPQRDLVDRERFLKMRKLADEYHQLLEREKEKNPSGDN